MTSSRSTVTSTARTSSITTSTTATTTTLSLCLCLFVSMLVSLVCFFSFVEFGSSVSSFNPFSCGSVVLFS